MSRKLFAATGALGPAVVAQIQVHVRLGGHLRFETDGESFYFDGLARDRGYRHRWRPYTSHAEILWTKLIIGVPMPVIILLQRILTGAGAVT
ncbi:hypothetical protein ACQPZ2_29630 [Nocardia pseudovaccinii]|uniref:hypothetical protein n=1 Tax=Nocardia pseudovaccinii TaxID=189540 RepID=UPI003D8DDF88